MMQLALPEVGENLRNDTDNSSRNSMVNKHML